MQPFSNPIASKLQRFNRNMAESRATIDQSKFLELHESRAITEKVVKNIEFLKQQIRQKDQEIKEKTTALCRNELDYQRQLKEMEEEKAAEIAQLHERLIRAARRNTQLQKELSALKMENNSQNQELQRSSSLLLEYL